MLRVIYVAHEDGNERVKNIVHSMNEADRDIYIVMMESKKTGWKGAEQYERPEITHIAHVEGEDTALPQQ